MNLTPNMEVQIEEPYRDAIYKPWNMETVKEFNFDSADIDKLEHGRVHWVDGTAYSLEEKEK